MVFLVNVSLSMSEKLLLNNYFINIVFFKFICLVYLFLMMRIVCILMFLKYLDSFKIVVYIVVFIELIVGIIIFCFVFFNKDCFLSVVY